MQTGQFAPAVDIAGGDARFSIAGLSRRSSWVTLAVTQSPPQRDGMRLRQATLDSVKRLDTAIARALVLCASYSCVHARRATSTGHGACRVHAPDTARARARVLCASDSRVHARRAAIAVRKRRQRCSPRTRTGTRTRRQPVCHMWRQLAHRHRTRCSLRTMHGTRRTHAAGRDGSRMGRCGPVAVSDRGTAETGHVARSSRLRPVPARPWRARHAAPPNAVREGAPTRPRSRVPRGRSHGRTLCVGATAGAGTEPRQIERRHTPERARGPRSRAVRARRRQSI